MPTTAATTVAVATAVTAVACRGGAAATGRTTRAEIAEVVGQLGVERLVEGHRRHVTVDGLAGLGARGALRARFPGGGARTARAVGSTGTGSTAIGLGPGGGRRQADLALLVDLLDDDLDLLAEREHVLDRVDPLAAAQLGDVHQAVAARE